MSVVYVDESWIKLNVGGQQFVTTRTTLCCKEPDSMLAKMFGAKMFDRDSDDGRMFCWNNAKDEDGAYLIDRSSKYFETILNYLRHGELIIEPNLSLAGLLEEAKFFNLRHLMELIAAKLKETEPITDRTPLTRRQVVKVLMKTPFSDQYQLRFQGVNFQGADLSFLDLRNINFKYANLQHANLTGANLSFSDLERANLSGAVLDNAQLLGIKLTCATMDNASLRKCNFEDPHQSSANLEGASLKGAVLEGSVMPLVNMRVASLKNANMKHCNLRSAVLAGADLENCDLTGSDLQEANLRGANFKDATFELMMTPLQMSQVLT